MIRFRRSAAAAVIVAVTVVVAACSGSDATEGGAGSRSTPAAPHEHEMFVPQPVGQFTVSAARRIPRPDAADRRALRRLARGAEPTPAELQAAMEDMADIGAHPDASPGDATAAERLANQVAGAKRAAARLATPAAARRAGYRLASGFLPGIGAHWIDWSRVTRPFDPEAPAMLLFDRGDDPQLVGLSYFVQSPDEPAGFRAAGAEWHRHAGLCVVHGVLVAESVERRADCDRGRGDLIPGRDAWMLHAWVVPGHENPLGTFAPLNSTLCSATMPCTPDGSIPTGAPASTTAASTPPEHAHLDYATPRAHAPVDGLHARRVNPIVVEVSRESFGAKPTAVQRKRADTLVRETVRTLRRYRRLDAAIAAGYVPLPDDPIHWYRPAFLTDDGVLDPTRPEFLVYVDPQRPADELRPDDPAPERSRRVVVGAMYWMPDAAGHGPQPGGPLTAWHFHEWSPDHWCGDDRGLPLATPAVDGTCPTGVPIGRSAEMLHVWTVHTPGGPFGTSMEFLRAPEKVLATNLVR